LCIQGLEEVPFSFELSDWHHNEKTGEMQEATAASTDSDISEDNSDEDMEQEAVEPGASASEFDTDEGSTSDEEAPLVS
jgi:hypothetical protein